MRLGRGTLDGRLQSKVLKRVSFSSFLKMTIVLVVGLLKTDLGTNVSDWISQQLNHSQMVVNHSHVSVMEGGDLHFWKDADSFFPRLDLSLDLFLALLSAPNVLLHTRYMDLIHPFVLDRVDVRFS